MTDQPVRAVTGRAIEPITGAVKPRCTATVLIHDDRFPMMDRCESVEGHAGPHTASRDACEPKAWLSWIGSHDDTSGGSDG